MQNSVSALDLHDKVLELCTIAHSTRNTLSDVCKKSALLALEVVLHNLENTCINSKIDLVLCPKLTHGSAILTRMRDMFSYHGVKQRKLYDVPMAREVTGCVFIFHSCVAPPALCNQA